MMQKCDASQISTWWCCFDNCLKSENFLLLVWCILFEDYENDVAIALQP